MKVFIYDKRESKPYLVLFNVTDIEERDNEIAFRKSDDTWYSVNKKFYKSTAYQN